MMNKIVTFFNPKVFQIPIVLIVAYCLLSFCSCKPKHNVWVLEEKEIIKIPIKLIDSNKTLRGKLLLEPFKGDICDSISIYFIDKQKNKKLLLQTSFSDCPSGLMQVSVSPSYKYIAMLYLGEGHTWLEIRNLKKWIQNGDTTYQSVYPYPGIFFVLGWQGDKLQVASNIDLLQIGDTNFINQPLSELFKDYLYDIENNRFETLH